ncbi:hypothetical protein Catovirus_1_826 [Catovirus CTV1]|uniref:Uncharacterized protein n=1 Tax=Catovirus CTV1 TaxID=1977631 RepID=A0A1V0SAP8_9VIRU|nr:hypothetical protein Catovirus_1_826 [Catovirus CTV1]
MYLIYIHNLKDNTIKPLDFSDTSDEAYKLLEDNAREFIIEHEGKKKWEFAFIDDKVEIDKLKDGFYLIKKNNTIEIHTKQSEIKNTGWILNSQETHHKVNLFSIYAMVEFQRHLLNKFITEKIVPYQTPIFDKPNNKTNDTPDKLKPNLIVRNNLNSVIDEIRKNGFRPIPRNKK